MVQIANISLSVQRFTEPGGKVVEIEPGHADSVEIDRDNVRLQAKVRAGLIIVGGTEAQAAKRAREKSPVAPAAAIAEGSE